MRRQMGTVGVLFSSVGVVIGSDWLFGALSASQLAGPGAILAWLIGGVAVAVIALNVAELGGMYAVAGGEVRFAHFAFGSFGGFAAGWFTFIATTATAPVEAEAMITFASGYLPQGLLINGQGELVGLGYVVAILLLLVFTLINVLGIRWMSEVNKYAVWWKLAIPALAIVALMLVSFRGTYFSAAGGHGGFLPFGFQGVLTAVTGGGVLFAYAGYDAAIAFGAEAKHPGRDIPIAVLGSLLIGVVLYFLLNLAFVGALREPDLVHGFGQITLSSNATGPFAALAGAFGLGWLVVLLAIDSLISPAGAGLLAIGINARYLFAMARQRYLPAGFGLLNARGTPVVAIVVTAVVGLLVFGPFPSWSEVIGFASSATVLVVALLPPTLGALRITDPDRPRPFKLPFAAVLSPLGFVVANELILCSGFGVVWKLFVATLIGAVVLLAGIFTRPPAERPNLDLRHSLWIAPWLVGLVIISFLGSFQSLPPDPNTIPFTTIAGGTGQVLHFGVDIVVLAAFSLGIYYLALYSRLQPEQTQRYLADQAGEAIEEV